MSSPIASLQRKRTHLLLLPLLALAQFISAIDYNIVVVALPDIGSELGFSSQSLQWVISAYALAFGGLLLFGGRAADVLGKRRLLLTGLVLYGVSSAAASFAMEPGLLIASRAVQGIGGALVLPAVLATINTSFDQGVPRYRAMSVWAGAGAAGLAAGSLLGGVLTSAFGWQAVFLVNVPLVIVAVVVAAMVIPADLPRDRSRRLDVGGAVLVTAGIALVVLALVEGPEDGWLSPLVVVSLAAGIALLCAFVCVEARVRDALLPLRLLRNRTLLAALLTAFLFMAGIGTMYYLYSLYLQDVLGLTPLLAGLAFLPWATVAILGSRIGRLSLGRFGLRPSLIGAMLLAAIGVALIALEMGAGRGYVWTLPGLALLAVGQAIGFASLFLAAGSSVSPNEQGVASAVVSTSQQIGSAMGLAALVALAGAVAESSSSRLAGSSMIYGLQAAAYAAAGLLLVGALTSLLLPRDRR